MTTVRTASRRAAFWTSSVVLALCLWGSAAPSVFYPGYAAEWQLTPVVITAIFATYPVALLLVLAFFGGLSDHIGRRAAMAIGVALFVASAVAFAVAPNVVWLFAGRILSGVGTGIALGAASAAMVEALPAGAERRASSYITASTAGGLTLATILSGALAEYAPFPHQLSFWLLTVLSTLALLAVLSLPRQPRRESRERWRPSPVTVPRSLAMMFATGTLSITLAYAVGAVFLSLGSSIARDLTGTSNLLVIGLLLGLSSATIGATSILIRRIRAHLAIIIGAVISILGLVVMDATAQLGSVGLFVAMSVVGGVGYAMAFTGGLSLINQHAPAEHRGRTLSAAYLVAYFGQAVTAIGLGAIATTAGLPVAIAVGLPVLSALAIASVTLSLVDGARRRSRARAELALAAA